MTYYQSGISSDGDAAILKRAGVEHVLVDQFDLSVCYPDKFMHVALDSGAFRAKRRGLDLSVVDYAEAVADIAKDLDFVVSLDVIGNAEESWRNWEYLRQYMNVVPVWHYDTPRAYLDVYLSNSEIVGIGGLASVFRDKDNPARRHVLSSLLGLAQQYPNRFHVFGLNWVKAINTLAPFLYSADSSLWLRGARYGISVFRNSRSQKLSQAPSYIMQDWAEKKGTTWASGRGGLLGANAAAIDRFCNAESRLEATNGE